MPCYHPITVYRSKEGPKNGKWPIVFNIKKGYQDKELQIPCGKCIGCRLERSRQWAVRCAHEAELYDKNCFLTLTYNNENLDKKGSLNKRDFVLFMKRLRKKYGENIRFFHCGEYGEVCKICGKHKSQCKCQGYIATFGRPHHHVCLFNHDFEDKILLSVKNGNRLYVSDELSALWPYGFSTIGSVTFESAAYVARYVMKKITGEKQPGHYGDKLPEYITMSRRPGIGKPWLEKYMLDVYPADVIIIRDGIKCRPSRYYDSIYDDHDPKEFERIKRERSRNRQELDYTVLDQKEKAKLLQIKKLKRELT